MNKKVSQITASLKGRRKKISSFLKSLRKRSMILRGNHLNVDSHLLEENKKIEFFTPFKMFSQQIFPRIHLDSEFFCFYAVPTLLVPKLSNGFLHF